MSIKNYEGNLLGINISSLKNNRRQEYIKSSYVSGMGYKKIFVFNNIVGSLKR